MKKQYLGIVRDHTGSMNHLAEQARLDYNSNLRVIQGEAKAHDIDTIASVVEVGISDNYVSSTRLFRRVEVNTSVGKLKELQNYPTPGGSTPLFNAVGDLIDVLESIPTHKGDDVAYLVLVITDGEENTGNSGSELGQRIRNLQRTDKWTFTFRVPFGHKASLVKRLGIPEGNVLEWEQTRQGFEIATITNTAATRSYYSERAAGVTRSTSFYASPADLSVSQLKRDLDDLTSKVKTFKVGPHSETIRDFVEKKTKGTYTPGSAYYQLVKEESRVQGYKKFLIRDRKTLKFYGGEDARELLGVPKTVGSIRLKPGTMGNFDVFVQSTSTNRKLTPHTEVAVHREGR